MKHCSICNQEEGVCLTCSERGCTRSFHVRCAQLAGCLMYPSVDGKKPQLQIYCDKHTFTPPAFPVIKSSLLRDYCEAFKLQEHASGAMRRANSVNLVVTCACHMEKGGHSKALPEEIGGLSRVRTLLTDTKNTAASAPDLACAECGNKFTPYWWDPPEHLRQNFPPGSKVCHLCHWKSQTSDDSDDSSSDEEAEGDGGDKKKVKEEDKGGPSA